MHLVIVESPAKCGKIQGFLGEGYSVVATMGHIRALKEDLAAIGLTSDFALTYTFLEEKARAIQGLKSAAARATSVTLAADDDREGEAIAYSVCVLLGLDPATTARAVFHEITKKAVVAAVASPRTLDMNRVNAQQARAVLDMMIGFTISPLLWKNVARGLSAGRCQTPALRLVCDREEAIGAHVAEMSWRVIGTWKGGLGAGITFSAHLADALEDEESARNYLEAMHEEPAATIYRATTRPWQRAPPLPFITSTLQQAASAVLRSGPKKTMAAAQKLYEAGYITYMRTDSAVLSSEAADAARAIVKERWGAEFCSGAAGMATIPAAGLKKKKATAATGPQQPQAQEAHEAIRPTHFEMEDIPAVATLEWTGPERRLYKLIWLRAIQSVMAPIQGEEAAIQFLLGVITAEAAAAEAAASFPWSTSWRRTTFLGWRKAGQAAEQGDDAASADVEAEDADTATWDKVIRLGPGDTLQWQTAQAKPHATTAPRRYNEATLIQALEKSGIGRPSTFASLVGTILDKSYVEKKDIAGHEEEVKELSLGDPTAWPPAEKIAARTVGGERERLVPTELGRAALGFAVKHFADLFAYDFTAAMEARLDAVARGEEEWKQLLRDTWATYKDRYEALGTGSAATGGNKSTATKKVFRDGLTAIVRKTGAPLLLKEIPGAAKGAKPTFYGWPEGVAFVDMTEEVALQFIAGKGQGQGQGQAGQRAQAEGDILGHWNGEAIVKRKGKFGTYIVCGKLTSTCGEDVTLEDAIERLEAKASMQTRVVGPYELRRTDRGAYMFKTTVKAKKFVTIPDGLDIMKLTAGEVEAIYKTAAPTAPAAPQKKKK
jgi:DNA topoisomerase-1